MDNNNGLWQDPALPEGIMCDSQGNFHWIYRLNMLKNPVVLYMIIKIILGVCGGIGIFIFIMLLLNHNTFGSAFKGFAIVTFGIGGLMLLIASIAYLIVTAMHGSWYIVEHRMNMDRVDHLQTHEEKEQSRKLKAAVFVIGLLSDDPSSMGLALGAAEEMTSSFKDVKKIIADRRHNLIKVNNMLQHNHIYAYPHQYEFVLDYICRHCPSAKVKR